MSILQSDVFQSINKRYLNIIYNRWYNLIIFLLLLCMLVITIICFFIDFYLHYQLLFLCRKALFSFLTVTIFIVVAFCVFHMSRIVIMFKHRAAQNPNSQSRLRWFTNHGGASATNGAVQEDEDHEELNAFSENSYDSEQEEEENEDPDKVLEKTYMVLEGKHDVVRAVIFIAQILFILLSVGLCLALLLFTIIAVPRQQKTLPQYEGTIKLSNSDQLSNVKLERESSGMIHIVAQSDYEAFFGQGVAHAQDRLFQLEFNKRVAAGTVSEILGSKTLDLDRVARTIGFHRAAQRDLLITPNETLTRIQAYCDGINRYIESNPHMPPTFGLLKISPSLWEPVDALATFKYISWTMSANHNREILRYKLLQSGLSLERLEQLLPHYDPTRYPTILTMNDLGLNLTAQEINEIEESKTDNSGYYHPLKSNSRSTGRTVHYTPEELSSFTAFEQYFGTHPFSSQGSNNWVVSGNHTQSGKPMLANDPHLKLSAPNIWYLNHIQSDDLDVIGASFVGVPGVIIGRNKHISWGITNSYADAQDIYALQMNPNNTYTTKDRAYELVERTEKIRVKGGSSVELKVQESIYGPIINDLYGVKDSAPLALYWTALQFDDATVDSYHQLNYATDFEQFNDALKKYVAPSMNFVYADNEGNIAYRLAGKIPQRRRGHSGRYVVPGTGVYDHDSGDIPFEKMPAALNPERGYIATANNRIAPPGYKYTLTQDYFRSWRALRIQELIQSYFTKQELMNWESMKAMQMDVKSYVFEDFRAVFQNMSFPEDNDMDSWRVRMVNWNGVEKVDTQEPALFEGWLQRVSMLVYDETGMIWKDPYFLHNAFATEDYACSRYFNLTCTEYAEKMLVETITSFRQQYGKVPAWGVEAHTAHFSHDALDGTAFKCMVSRDVLSAGGSGTINTAEVSDSNLVTTVGVTYRQIIDMTNESDQHARRVLEGEETESSDKFIIPMGQSGNYFSPFYQNLLPLWYSGTYLDMKMDNFESKFKLNIKANNK